MTDTNEDDSQDNNYVLGIDLGTSNSSAAIMKGDLPVVIPNEFGLLTTPSYVSFLEPEKRLVGQLSKINILSHKNTIFNSKRLIGKKYSDKSIMEIEGKLPFNIREDIETKKVLIETNFSTKNGEQLHYYYPEQISAIILKKLKNDAEKYLYKTENKKVTIKKVVITTPAYFNQQQRKGTKQAAEIAGLEVIGIINEPTAASLAFGLFKVNDTKNERKILILDFGGGTLDFTLLTFSKEDNEIYCDIECSFGDHNFGGEDFDNLLMNYILNKKGLDYLDNYQKLRLKLACEKAKIELSKINETEINIEEFSEKGDIKESITREEFEKICDYNFKKFKDILGEFLKESNLKDKILISDIILVGGTTKIPKIKEIIKKEFPDAEVICDINKNIGPNENNDKYKNIDPSLSVAIGAAMFASMKANPYEYDNIHLFDVTNFSFGTNVFSVEKNKDIYKKLIKRYSQLPAFKEKIYITHEDNQTSIVNDIYEGEKEELSENLFLGTFRIDNLPKKPKGKASIKLKFEINTDSILEATCIDLSNEDNYSEIKLKLKEPNGFEEEKFEKLKEKENKSETLEFPGYEAIRDNILENQSKINLDKEKEGSIYFDSLNKFLTLVSNEKEFILEEINGQLYISYVKYIFNFAKEYFKNYYVTPEQCEILKEKFKDIVIFIVFLYNEKNDLNNDQNNNDIISIDEFYPIYKNQDIGKNIINNTLFELLDYLIDNIIIHQYFLSAIIEFYNSILKEIYLNSDKSDDFNSELEKCEKIQEITEKLLMKIENPNAISKGIQKEITLYKLKIKIKKFLHEYKNDLNIFEDKNLLKLYKQKAKNYYEEINKTEDMVFFHDELESLGEINKTFGVSYEELYTKNDMEYLYELVKYFPPKLKIKTEEDIKEEIITFIQKYEKNDKNTNKEQKEKEVEKDKILGDRELNKLFKSIFFDKNKLLINENNESKYIKKRLKQENEKKEKNKDFYNKFDVYFGDYGTRVKKLFLDNPYKTLKNLISIYRLSDNNIHFNHILNYLNIMKNNLKEQIDRINIILLKNEKNLSVFYYRLLENFKPIYIQYENPLYSYEKEANEKLKSKIKSIKSMDPYYEYDDNQKFEYFQNIYEIYQISYLKTYRRDYLAVIGELNKIKSEFEEKNFEINSKYEKKIIGNC